MERSGMIESLINIPIMQNSVLQFTRRWAQFTKIYFQFTQGNALQFIESGCYPRRDERKNPPDIRADFLIVG